MVFFFKYLIILCKYFFCFGGLHLSDVVLISRHFGFPRLAKIGQHRAYPTSPCSPLAPKFAIFSSSHLLPQAVQSRRIELGARRVSGTVWARCFSRFVTLKMARGGGSA